MLLYAVGFLKVDGDAAKALIAAIPSVLYKETAAFLRSHQNCTYCSAVDETQGQIGDRKNEEEEAKGDVDELVRKPEENNEEMCSICLMHFDVEEIVKELK